MKVVSLINMKGGVAKTTLAINLADCLATRHNSKVLLIDVDPQFNATQCLMTPENYMEHVKQGLDTVVKIFDRKNRITAGTVSQAKAIAPKALDEVEVINIKKNLDLLPGNLELYRLEMAPGDGRENRLKNFLKSIEDKYDYVVIDTPPTPSIWMTSALIASNYYLIPVKADPISLTGIDLLKSIIEEKRDNFNLDIKCAGLVLTIAETTTKVFQNAKVFLSTDKYWKSYLYPIPMVKRTAIAKNQLDQNQILDGEDPEAKKALTAITTEFTNRVANDARV
jgi:chromosome partitioning protein